MTRHLKTKTLKYLTSLAVIWAFSSPALAQEEKPKGFTVDKIVAKVDNYIVLRSELESAYQSYLADGNPATEDVIYSVVW